MWINAKATLLVVVMLAAAMGHAKAADIPTKAAPAPASPSPFFIVNDNSIGYYYAPTATNPGAGQTPKNVLAFTHVDVWEYGTNFFNVEWMKATNGKSPLLGTPATPCDQNGPLDPPGSERCPGFTEIYGFFRSSFGWNQILKTKAFAVGPLTNVEFAVGADANTDNTTSASAKRSIQGGLQFDFGAPYKGFLNIGLYAYKEWQHDGFASTFPFQTIPNPSGNVNFNPTWAVEVNYAQPLGFLPTWLPLTYKAVVVIHGPKGCGETCEPLGPGLIRTTEYLTQQSLHLDVGQIAWNKPNQFSVWVGYRWWKNKFGISPTQPNSDAGRDPDEPAVKNYPFTLESTWLMGTTLTF